MTILDDEKTAPGPEDAALSAMMREALFGGRVSLDDMIDRFFDRETR